MDEQNERRQRQCLWLVAFNILLVIIALAIMTVESRYTAPQTESTFEHQKPHLADWPTHTKDMTRE